MSTQEMYLEPGVDTLQIGDPSDDIGEPIGVIVGSAIDGRSERGQIAARWSLNSPEVINVELVES